MNVAEFAEVLEGKLLTGDVGRDNEVVGIYCCDLLSWVMAHASEGDVWITIQTHSNIIAVATLVDLSAIIIAEDAEVEEETIKKAIEEGIPVLVSDKNAFMIAKGLADMGLGN